MERLAQSAKERAVEDWIEKLHRPLPGVDPDKVSDSVVASELAAFGSFAAEVG